MKVLTLKNLFESLIELEREDSEDYDEGYLAALEYLLGELGLFDKEKNLVDMSSYETVETYIYDKVKRNLQMKKIVEIAEENGWKATFYSDNGDDFYFDFSKISPQGHDFIFSAWMKDNEVDTLIDNIYQYYDEFDCSSEAYLWLDSTGHGINGAPYDMKDVYEGMEACRTMIIELHDELNKFNWETI